MTFSAGVPSGARGAETQQPAAGEAAEETRPACTPLLLHCESLLLNTSAFSAQEFPGTHEWAQELPLPPQEPGATLSSWHPKQSLNWGWNTVVVQTLWTDIFCDVY